MGKKSEDRHIFKYRQHKNIEKIEEKNENKRKKRDSNELHMKITWVLDSKTEFQFSIHFHGHVHIVSLKNTLIWLLHIHNYLLWVVLPWNLFIPIPFMEHFWFV